MTPVVRWVDVPKRLRTRRAVRRWLAALDVPDSLRGEIMVLSLSYIGPYWARAADEVVAQLVVERDADVLLICARPGTFDQRVAEAARRRNVEDRVGRTYDEGELLDELRRRGLPVGGLFTAMR